MKTQPTLLNVLRTLLAAAIAAVYPVVARAATESPSELLEKGIYAQDTKGDVDSAIAIYQQLVSEQDINRSLAAQAQFRLGQCYAKQNRTADATAAFQKLIHDYPNETNLVAQARASLPSGLTFGPVPWVDGERLQLNISMATGMDIGTAEYRADLVQQANGRQLWRVGCRMMAAGPQSISTVDVDPETFRPFSSHWKHSLLGEASATYDVDQVRIQRADTAQPVVKMTDGIAYDNEEAMHAMRRLPLQVGYKTTLPVFSTLSGGNNIAIPLEVTGKETVEVPAGKVECFKVHLGIVSQDFWFSADTHRYLVKYAAGPVIAQLTSISQRPIAAPVKFQDSDLGISFTVPADWVVWRAKNGQPAHQQLIRTLDPDADTYDGGIRLFSTDSLSATAQQSSRAWADEHHAKEKNVTIRPGSWQNYFVDGRLGVGCIGDYSENGKPRVQFLLHMLGKTNSELFALTAAPDKFDALKAQFDTIIASYRTK
jgi:hypothetical protein